MSCQEFSQKSINVLTLINVLSGIFPKINKRSDPGWKIVERQLESVLLTQPWKSIAKKDPKFALDFRKALTSIVMAREDPPMLDNLDERTISVLNKYQEALPEVLRKVSLSLNMFNRI